MMNALTYYKTVEISRVYRFRVDTTGKESSPKGNAQYNGPPFGPLFANLFRLAASDNEKFIYFITNKQP